MEIELLSLPAYSPNLKLIECLWKLVKTRCLRNWYFGKSAFPPRVLPDKAHRGHGARGL